MFNLLLAAVAIFNLGITSVFAQEDNQEIIKAEVEVGHQYISNHGQHLALNAKGESNIGRFQILPFQVSIYTHYHDLTAPEIQNLKITAINFMMDNYSVGAPTYTKQSLGYGNTRVHTQTLAPLTGTAFHTVKYNGDKLIVNISGYISVPGKAFGFGQNTQEVFHDKIADGVEFNDGTYFPTGAKVGVNFNNKFQVNGTVDYQRFQASDKQHFQSPVSKRVISDNLILNTVNFGINISANLGNLLTQKLRGVNLYASITSQNLNYKLSQDDLTIVRTNHGSEKTNTRTEPHSIAKESYTNFQVGVKIDINAGKKKKTPKTF